MLSPNQPTDKLENISAFMADWGIGIQHSGQVIMESEKNNYVGTGLYPLLQFSEEHLFGEVSRPAIGYAPVPIEVLWDHHSGVSVTTMISTSKTAYSVSAEEIGKYEPKEEDMKSFPMMTVSSKAVGGEKVTYSYLVTLASAEMFNSCIGFSSTANPDAALQLFRYLTDTTGDENKIYIAPTDLTASDFTVSAGLVNTVGMTIFMIVVPIIIIGLYVYGLATFAWK